jgi:hypothetical protein
MLLLLQSSRTAAGTCEVLLLSAIIGQPGCGADHAAAAYPSGEKPMSLARLLGVAGLLAVTGCVDPPSEKGAAPSPGAESSSSAGPIQTRKTINQKTQNVMRMEEAVAAGGVPAEKPENDGGLGVIAGAYRSSVAKLGNIAVQQAMQFYEAEHGELPSNYDEFMKWIIKPGQPDGIELAMLPYYQEYSYDEQTRQLVVMEFPAKKEQRQRETTGAAGL